MNFDFNRLYLTTDGRIGRQEFWIGSIGLIVIGIVAALIVAAIFGWQPSTAGLVANFIISLILAYPSYALMAKRFQDREKPATYAAIVIGINIVISFLGLFGIGAGDPTQPSALGIIFGLVMLAIAIWVIVELGFLRGTVGANAYGPDPVGP